MDKERNGNYIKADGTNGTYSDAYNFVNGPWINGTMLDEVVNAGYPYYYLFDDVNDDADGSMNKDGKTFCSNRTESCLLCYPTPTLPLHLHSLSLYLTLSLS